MKQIPLTQGYVTVVDDEDYPVLIRHKWWAVAYRKTSGEVGWVYAACKIDGVRILMQNYLLPPLPDKPHILVDHKDRDGLNNRRSNLAYADRSLNNHNRRLFKGNTSTYRGVSAYRNGWRASIGNGDGSRWLGDYTSETAAARAYDVAAREMYGERAMVNFPSS